MREKLCTLFGIKPGEESLVSILLIQSVLLGIFLGSFDIYAHSVFLSVFDVKMMARGYVISGLAGIILTTVYSRLKTKMGFRESEWANFIFTASVTLLLWILMILNPSNTVIFLVFILFGPLNILSLQSFRGTIRILFTAEQEKRLSGLLESGLFSGIILISFSIPVLLSLDYSINNILLISVLAFASGNFMLMLASKKLMLTRTKDFFSSENSSTGESVLHFLGNNRYIRIMSIFIALSVMTTFFVQYSFMAVTRVRYPTAVSMAGFLGLFTGSMAILTILMRLIVFPFIIRNWGLKACLAASPVVISFITIMVIISGTSGGYATAALGFTVLFMLLALSRLFSLALKNSSEFCSLRISGYPFEEKSGPGILSQTGAILNEASAMASGLLLTFLGIFSFISLIHFSFVLIIITLAWIYVSIKLYSGYRESVKALLDTERESLAGDIPHGPRKQYNNLISAGIMFRKEYFNLISGNFSSHDFKNNPHFRNFIVEYADSKKDINLLSAVKSIAAESLSNDEHQRSLIVAENLQYALSPVNLKDDKIFSAMKMLADQRQPQTTYILRLLRDKSVDVRTMGIYLIGKFRFTDMIPDVCECLNNPDTVVPAISVLKHFGEDASGALEKYFMKSSGNPGLSKIILQLLGDGCRKENMNFLFLCLWSGSRQIRETALKNLAGCGHKAQGEDRERLNQLISDVIETMVWNLSARLALKGNGDKAFQDAMDKEIETWDGFLFSLLSITYDPVAVQCIWNYVDGGSDESFSVALELIDLIADDSVKTKLAAVIYIKKDERNVRKLSRLYPGEIPVYKKLIEDIINRDYNLLGIWIRANALRNIPGIESGTLPESLVALLFSPAIILQEESSRLLARSGYDLYKSVSVRIPVATKARLDKIVNKNLLPEEMVYEKVLFLSHFLPTVNKDILIELAELLEFRRNIQTGQPSVSGYIIWSQKEGSDDFNMVIVNDQAGMEEIISKSEGSSCSYYLSLKKAEEFLLQYPEYENEFHNLFEMAIK